MKITDLRIGDIVCNKQTKFPMKVVGIYEDGTAYLDFDAMRAMFSRKIAKTLNLSRSIRSPKK